MGHLQSAMHAVQGDQRVKLELSAPSGEMELFFRARRTIAGQRWFGEIDRATAQKLCIKDPWRVCNAPGGPNTSELVAKLHQCITTINSHHPGTIPKDVRFDENASPVELQEALNYAHIYFEAMMHSADQPARFYVDAWDTVQCAIEHLNLLIHALEDDSRQKVRVTAGEAADVRIVVTFSGRRRLPLRDAELQDFGLIRDFGAAYLNYCMMGKHLLEACSDDDHVTRVLRPQTHLSADVVLRFGHSTTTDELRELEWWAPHDTGVRFGRHDPASALGYLPVADLCRDMGSAAGKVDAELVRMLGGSSIQDFGSLGGCRARKCVIRRCLRRWDCSRHSGAEPSVLAAASTAS